MMGRRFLIGPVLACLSRAPRTAIPTHPEPSTQIQTFLAHPRSFMSIRKAGQSKAASMAGRSSSSGGPTRSRRLLHPFSSSTMAPPPPRDPLVLRALRLSAFLVLLVACTMPSYAAASRAHFDQWKLAYGKTYATAAEEERRYGHWLQQFEHVRRRRQQQDQQQQRQQQQAFAYELGLNEFSDLSPEEHRGRFLVSGFVPQGWRVGMDLGHARVFNGDKEDPPAAVDWRDPALNLKGVKAVTPVRNQAYCGGCYSFAVTAAVEGVVAADEGVLNQISDEQILDCDANNNGCGGGDPQLALEYVRQHPLAARTDYPYTAAMGHASPVCRADGLAPCSGIQSYLSVRPCDDRVLMQAVARAPVVVALDAHCPEFMTYKAGVMTFSCAQPLDGDGEQGPGAEITDAMCEREVNHAVAIVGYGTDAKTGLDYWLVKNSWGQSWGERGYGRIQRGKGGETGSGGEELFECGLGCISYYSFLPVGGVAYVNGTAIYDDDYPQGDIDSAELKEDVLSILRDVLAGATCALVVFTLVGLASALARACRREGGDGRRRQQQSGLRQPLLVLEEEENVVVIPPDRTAAAAAVQD